MRLSSFVLAAAAGSAVAGGVFGQSQPTWRAMPALNGPGRALLVTSGAEAGGNGSPALWVGGDFTQIGSVPAGRAGKLVGGTWVSTGSFDYEVQALCEHDGGSGAKVYIGGSFNLGAPNGTADCIGWYNGASWSLTPAGYMLSWCNSLTSFQMPGQPRRLLASGSPVGGSNYAKALGPSGWEAVGDEFITVVDDALVYDDGGGVELFTANGTFNGVNKYNGTRRAALGGNCFSVPRTLAGWGPEGGGTRLYVGGNLNRVNTLTVAGVAKWDGAAWSGLGGTGWGVFKSTGAAGWVHKLIAWDDGSGEKLWMVGQFDAVGGATAAQRVAAQNIAAWDGTVWSLPGAGGLTGLPNDGSFINGVETAVVFEFDGPGGRPPALVVTGKFTGAGGLPVSNFAVLEAAWCGAADVGRQGGVAKPDGKLDNNDFVVFVDLFFGGSARADLGVQGGVAGHDGAFDNNDFVVFVDSFFATGQPGCNP